MKHNLPPRRLFFNRRKEIDEIRRALGDRAARILTITGGASVGKTALALEIAHREKGRDRFRGVIWLSGFTTARDAWAQIAAVVIPSSEGEEARALRRARAFLRDYSSLLVFDALTASDAALEFINAIASEETKILVTGEKLGLAQRELVWELDVLELPTAFAALATLWDAHVSGILDGALTRHTSELNADVVETARTLADDYASDGENDSALAVLEIARRGARQIQDKKLEANCLTNIGLIYSDKGDLDKALEYLASALATQGITADAQRILQNQLARIRQEQGEKEFDARWERMAARLNQRFAALDRAQEAEKAKKFAETAQALVEVRTTYNEKKLDAFEWWEYAQLGWRQALALKRAGELLQALDALNKTFREFKNAKDLNARARVCLEMGHVSRMMDNYEDAWVHYTDAYRLFKRAGDKRMMAVAKEERGTLEFFFKSPDATADLQEAYQLYSESNERVRARAVEQMVREARAVYAANVESGEPRASAGEAQ